MKVVDAGVVIELLVSGLDPARLGDDDLAAPHLLDTEVTHVLRRLVRQAHLHDDQALQALDGFRRLQLRRYPAEPLLARMWELRSSLSAYDATYVAVAEAVGAIALLTTDARLAHAPGIRCSVQLL
ncbi:MAG: type II toxin-antitoxin system VapC family toxin [Actinomycetes bacterium]